MSHAVGMGGFGGCPTGACVVAGCDKGFPRAAFGGVAKKNSVQGLENERGAVWSLGNFAKIFHILSVSPRMD